MSIAKPKRNEAISSAAAFEMVLAFRGAIAQENFESPEPFRPHAILGEPHGHTFPAFVLEVGDHQPRAEIGFRKQPDFMLRTLPVRQCPALFRRPVQAARRALDEYISVPEERADDADHDGSAIGK